MRLAAIGVGEGVDAEHADVAGVGLQQPGDHAQGRGLARAVGAEQRVELAGLDGQVEPVDGRLAEALAQFADAKRRRLRTRSVDRRW